MLRPVTSAGLFKIQLGLADLTQSRLAAILTARDTRLTVMPVKITPHMHLDEKPGILAY